MNVQSKYGDKICSLFKQSDCNNILETSAAKLFGVISWSEVGLSYFISNTVVLLFFPQLINYMAIINVFALPYTIWSIWYQKNKAKQWCPLCLIVQLLIWLVFVINLIGEYIRIPSLNGFDIVVLTCAYIIPYLIINLLISQLTDKKKVEQLTQELNSIKTDETVFAALLKKQTFYKVDLQTSTILWGNKSASILVTILTNPHCNPCAKMHKRIENLLKETDKHLCIQYIFSSFQEEYDISNKALIAIYQNNIIETSNEIFNDWFSAEKQIPEHFIKKHNLIINSIEVETEFLKHEKWKQDTGIRETPTILINGYKLPANCKIEDLKYITNLDL